MKWRLIWLVGLLLLWLFCSGAASADSLTERLQQFPNWQAKPTVQVAKGDLAYPDWMAGEWTVTTTLIDLVAPLAPEVVTPGFESNRQYLNQPVPFDVRFVEERSLRSASARVLLPLTGLLSSQQIVSDRAFNGRNLAKAYLGDRAVYDVKVDPSNPNRQITLLRGDRQLVSTVIGRATETPSNDTFVTTEVFQQQFRGAPQLYFNEVETTTAYERQASGEAAIVADQVTAIYLSSQDPDYFKVGDRPVALYRYRLEFFPRSL